MSQPTPNDPDTVAPGQFIAYRHPDPIRAAALQAAVQHVGPYCYQDHADGWTQVMEVARQFEQYLAGEEADG